MEFTGRDGRFASRSGMRIRWSGGFGGRASGAGQNCPAGVGDPGLGLGLEVHVAVHPVGDARGPEGSQALVEVAPGLAEVLVARIPEGQHREVQVLAAWGAIGMQKAVQFLGFVGRLALAVGAHHHQHVPRLLKGSGAEVRHVLHLGDDSQIRGRLLRALGDARGVPGL